MSAPDPAGSSPKPGSSSQHSAARSGLLGAAVGVLAVTASLLPWFARGARLPLQNLWREQTLPGDMPLSLLPLSQYTLLTLLALHVAAGVMAGFGVRWLRRDVRGATLAGAGAGLLLAQGIAAGQSMLLLARGVRDLPLMRAYQLGLAALLVGSMVTALLALLLIGSRSPLVAAYGLVLAAVGSGRGSAGRR